MGVPKLARQRVTKNKRASLHSHNVASSAADFLNASGSYEAGRNAARSQGIGRLAYAHFKAVLSTDTREAYAKAERSGIIRSGEGSVIVRPISVAAAAKAIAAGQKAKRSE